MLRNKFNSSLVGLLVLMLVALFVPAAPAYSAPDRNDTVEYNDIYSALESRSGKPKQDAQAGIIKGGKLLLKGLSGLLRSGQVDNVIKKIPGLDDGAKNAIKNNKDGVANAIDDVLGYADIPERTVRSVLFESLTKNGFAHGDAQVIADAIAGAVGFLV